jgi:Tfp pilus assembly protein PilN
VIRTNLSTRPFYNERGVHVCLLVAAVLVVAATVFNVSRVIRYSRSDTELGTLASQGEARAADLRAEAARLRATVDPRQIDFASIDARQANDLIDRRTFSWTELLNLFETTLPDDVRIAAVRPTLDAKLGNVLIINVVARSVDDVDRWMENLEKTGTFKEIGHALEEHVNDQGLLEASIETTYVPVPAPVRGAASGAAPGMGTARAASPAPGAKQP